MIALASSIPRRHHQPGVLLSDHPHKHTLTYQRVNRPKSLLVNDARASYAPSRQRQRQRRRSEYWPIAPFPQRLVRGRHA